MTLSRHNYASVGGAKGANRHLGLVIQWDSQSLQSLTLHGTHQTGNKTSYSGELDREVRASCAPSVRRAEGAQVPSTQDPGTDSALGSIMPNSTPAQFAPWSPPTSLHSVPSSGVRKQAWGTRSLYSRDDCKKVTLAVTLEHWKHFPLSRRWLLCFTMFRPGVQSELPNDVVLTLSSSPYVGWFGYRLV